MVADIKRAVAAHYGLPFEAMHEPDRNGARLRERAQPRQMAMLLARRMTRKGYLTLAVQFKRDHSTVHHGVRKARRLCLSDRQVLKAMCEIKAAVLGNQRTVEPF
jgi:chromosomal replication initiator protein